jgi:hypothetical protein
MRAIHHDVVVGFIERIEHKVGPISVEHQRRLLQRLAGRHEMGVGVSELLQNVFKGSITLDQLRDARRRSAARHISQPAAAIGPIDKHHGLASGGECFGKCNRLRGCVHVRTVAGDKSAAGAGRCTADERVDNRRNRARASR